MSFLLKVKNWLQPRLYWKDIFKYYSGQVFSQKSSIQIVNTGQEQSVLVLCPHIDDDVIGLGGTLYQYRKLGIPVTVIYFSKENERRQKEGEKISEFLAYKKVSFYDFTVEQISSYSEIPEILYSSLKDNSFDLIYTPFYLDRHKDHIAVARHLGKALEKIGELRAEIRSYEVWSPLFPNQVVDISNVVEYKKEGILICQSQMDSLNYVDLALSLNRYRGLTSSRARKMEYAEAFYSCSPYTFLKLLQFK